MKNPLDARCVFISGPVALFLHEDTPESIRRGLADVTLYAETFIDMLPAAVPSKLPPPITAFACPQLKVDDGMGSWGWVNLTEDQYASWFKSFSIPGTVPHWDGRKVYAHRALPSVDWTPV